MRPHAGLAATLAVLAAGGCGGGERLEGDLPSAPARVVLTSPVFATGQPLPDVYTCDGEDSSPPLSWSEVPAAARELALVVDDRDAGGFVHWAIWGIAPDTESLEAGEVPAGALQGKNTFGHERWDGPCPPKGDGPHRYEFTLYALSAPLGLKAGASPEAVSDALASKALGRGRLVGTFDR